jgi:hypothetical protein
LISVLHQQSLVQLNLLMEKLKLKPIPIKAKRPFRLLQVSSPLVPTIISFVKRAIDFWLVFMQPTINHIWSMVKTHGTHLNRILGKLEKY